jgi:hypothetical protein
MIFLMTLGASLYVCAQSVPVATPIASAVPAVIAPAVSSGLTSATFIGVVVAIVAGLNVLLSSVQQIFSSLSKAEPGWLSSISSVILAVAKYLGSNPNA